MRPLGRRRYRGPEPGKPERPVLTVFRCRVCGHHRGDKRHRAHVVAETKAARG
ncbi:MAG: hypothetical protein FJ027_21305 [Candidatus Rokubacteria bacterium]|nr:hypothetical protein [Candidatus Rokubacteria bacterium]